jgi:hypothetical protein
VKQARTNKGQGLLSDADHLAPMSKNLTLQEAIAIALKQEPRGMNAVNTPGVPDDAPTRARGDAEWRQDHIVTRGPGELGRLELTRQMHNLLLNVEVAYWNLYAAHGRLQSNEDMLHELGKLSLEIDARVKSGAMDPNLPAQIAGQYHEFRGERTDALGAVLDAERNLRGIIGLPTEDTNKLIDSNRLIPVTSPVLAAPELPGWDVLLGDALSRRPDLLIARENLSSRRLALARERKSVQPELASSEDNKRLEPASIRSARLQLDQAFYVLKDREERAKRTLEQQYQAVNKYHRLMADRKAERRAYTESLKSKFSLVQLGKRGIDLDVLDVERRSCLAATKEYQAIAEYNNSLARLAFARGTIMERHGVQIVENGPNLLAQLASANANPNEPKGVRKDVAPAANDRIHLVTAHFDVYCKRLTRLGNPDHMLLEGDVRLISMRNGQTIRIEGERVLVRVNDGTFTVEAQKAAD